jgi:hypothetical protein
MPMRRLGLLVRALVPMIIILLLPTTAASASSALPRVMAATGDSITPAQPM